MVLYYFKYWGRHANLFSTLVLLATISASLLNLWANSTCVRIHNWAFNLYARNRCALPIGSDDLVLTHPPCLGINVDLFKWLYGKLEKCFESGHFLSETVSGTLDLMQQRCCMQGKWVKSILLLYIFTIIFRTIKGICSLE